MASPPPGLLYHGVYPGGRTGHEDDLTPADVDAYEAASGARVAWIYFSNNWYREPHLSHGHGERGSGSAALCHGSADAPFLDRPARGPARAYVSPRAHRRRRPRRRPPPLGSRRPRLRYAGRRRARHRVQRQVVSVERALERRLAHGLGRCRASRRRRGLRRGVSTRGRGDARRGCDEPDVGLPRQLGRSAGAGLEPSRGLLPRRRRRGLAGR